MENNLNLESVNKDVKKPIKEKTWYRAKQLSEYWDDINLIYDLRINAQLDSKTIFDELFNYKTNENTI